MLQGVRERSKARHTDRDGHLSVAVGATDDLSCHVVGNTDWILAVGACEFGHRNSLSGSRYLSAVVAVRRKQGTKLSL